MKRTWEPNQSRHEKYSNSHPDSIVVKKVRVDMRGFDIVKQIAKEDGDDVVEEDRHGGFADLD
jgi:hypothetical protein